jgi:hypothetical protein
MRREHAVIARQMLSRRWDERGQLGQKLHRFALHGALAVWRGSLVLVANLAFVGPPEAFLGERGAEAVAAQALEAVAIVFVHGHVGVQREAGDERRAPSGRTLGSASATGAENVARTDAACT